MDPSPKASSTVHILIEGHRPLAGLAVDLGYLWMKHQGALRRLVPRWLLLTTPLVQLPLIRTCFRTRDATLLVVWEDAAVSELSWLEASSNIRIDSQVEVIVVRASQPEWSNFLSKQTDQQEQALLLDLVDRVRIRVAELSRKECQPKLRGVLELVLYSSKPCLTIQSADLMFLNLSDTFATPKPPNQQRQQQRKLPAGRRCQQHPCRRCIEPVQQGLEKGHAAAYL